MVYTEIDHGTKTISIQMLVKHDHKSQFRRYREFFSNNSVVMFAVKRNVDFFMSEQSISSHN